VGQFFEADEHFIKARSFLAKVLDDLPKIHTYDSCRDVNGYATVAGSPIRVSK
jgi:hypothetical protein